MQFADSVCNLQTGVFNRKAMAERKQGYDLNAVRSCILGNNRKPQQDNPSSGTPRGGGGEDAHRQQRKKRKRPRSRKVKSDSDSSSSSDDEEPVRKPTGGAKGKADAKAKPVSAFPAMQKLGAKDAEKATLEARTKYRKHCASFLLDKCMRTEYRFEHKVPAGFKAQARIWGFKQMGAAANGVEFE